MNNRARKSLSDALFETNYQSKFAAELWLNIGEKEYRLVGRRIKIGRAVDNDIVLDHKSCSRYHAILRIESGRIILEDLKSRNGVRVNDHKISRVELKENAEIQIGDLKGIFYQRERSVPKQNREITSTGHYAPDVAEVVGDEKQGLLERIQRLPKIAKLGAMGLMPFVLFAVLIISNSAGPTNAKVEEENGFRFHLTEDDIIEAALPRAQFQVCQEEEELGNFRRARMCLKALPLTRQVFYALQRVITRQHDLSQQRFLEGERALQNKYYDLAIIKLQEVLLIADDDSELRQKIPRMIDEAKEGKRLL